MRLTISLQDGVIRELVTMFPTSKIKKNDKNEVRYSLRISLKIYLNTPALFLQLVDERNAEDDIEEPPRDQEIKLDHKNSYCYRIEEDPRTYNEAMQSRDAAF
ncbi:hypothetical protein Tco_0509613 [Tanacetum coccineum]